MAMTCTVGLLLEDESVRWIYIRHDGDLIGGLLAARYTTPQAVTQLLDLGPLIERPEPGQRPKLVKADAAAGVASSEDAYLEAARGLEVAFAYIFDELGWIEASTGLRFINE